MANSPDRRRADGRSVSTEEIDAATERMAEILDTVHDSFTPNGENQYWRDLKELQELIADFPDEYSRLFFLRCLKHFNRLRGR